MSNKYSKSFPIALAIVLMVLLTLTITFSFTSETVIAEDVAKTETGVKPLTIGHITDIHYFPLQYCYKEVNAKDYYTSDFYDSMTGDTKLVLESGLILAKTIKSIMKDADEGKAPLYFVVSGDLSKNGEHVALIDVANALRKLQNYVRSKTDVNPDYANFQIFVNQGNHDLYNSAAAIYDPSSGSSIKSDAVSAATFALIFAGLGYPNASLDGSTGANLTDYYEEQYWSSSYTDGYQPSTLSTSVDFKYYNEYLQDIYEGNIDNNYGKIGSDSNVLSYIASINATGYEPYTLVIADATTRSASTSTIIRLLEAEYSYLKSIDSTYISSNTFYEGNGTNIRYKKLSSEAEINNAFDNNKQVYVTAGLDAECGGRLTEDFLNWIEDYTNNNVNAAGATTDGTCIHEESYAIVFHMNLLPHWEQEDDILKDFVIYNYENTAKRLLSMGIHYALTGHQHSSDIMAYTDVLGRTIYDMQTNSSVSYDSQRRYLTLNRYNCGGKLGEAFASQLYQIEDLKEIPSDHIFTAIAWNDNDYKNAYQIYKNASTSEKESKWNDLLATNPDYYTYTLRYDELSTLSYNEFSNKDIYSILIDRLLDHFVSEGFLGGMINGLYPSIDNNTGIVKTVAGILGIENTTISNILRYIVDVAFGNYDGNKLDSEYYLFKDGKYPDYYDSTKTYDNAFDYIKAIAYPIVNMSYGDESIISSKNPTNAGKLTLAEMAEFILIAHTSGVEVSLSDTSEQIYAQYTEKVYTDRNSNGEIYGFKNPLDATYRVRMVAALKDLKTQAESGKFVEDLLNKLLDPLYRKDNSLLKQLLTYNFNLQVAVDAGYISQKEHDALEQKLTNLVGLFNNPKTRKTFYAIIGSVLSFELPEDFSLPNIDIDNLELLSLVNSVIDIVKPLVANLIGFNMDGPDLYTIVDNALSGYLTESFNIGLGGIAYDIIISYATDVYPDNTDNTDLSKATLLQPSKVNAGNYGYGSTQLSYLSTLNKPSEVGATFNAATQENGRVPSHITSNFDTVDSTTTYTFKFYTEEYVYGTFRFKSMDETSYHEVSTTASKANIAYETKQTDYKDVTVVEKFGNITVTVFTQTIPQYIPLIDLGLLCLTHAEIQDENEIKYIYGDRDYATNNSIIYWNVTTVTITGLTPNTTYCYDLLGNYEINNTFTYFSTVDFAKLSGYDKSYYTFTTAADDSITDFEFLTIADIQGMIESMYTNSYKAVEAILSDNRTNTYDFILNAGDMADSGKNFYQWGYALNTYEKFFANTSLFFTAGNHEGGTYAMSNFFNYTLPKGENKNTEGGLYYSFNYGNSHFIVLNTNDASSEGLGKEQLNWLTNDLKNNNKKWTFVLMHKSLYSGGSHSTDAEVVAMRKQLIPLFADNNVSMVFAGHDHTYTTTYLIDKDGNAEDKTSLQGVQYTGDGVLYVTLGTMGTKYYTYAENDNTTPYFDGDKSILNTLDSQTFGKVVVTDNMITYTSYYYNQDTKQLEVIGETKLSDKDVLSKEAAIALIVVIPTVCIGGIVATLIILKKKGKLGKKAVKISDAISENTAEEVNDVTTDETKE